MGKLILVRHGHTPLNGHGKDERLRAWLDIPLDDQGMREGEEIAEKLSHLDVTGIYSSDLRRARQTAEMIRQSTKSSRNHDGRTPPVEFRSVWRPATARDHPFFESLERAPGLTGSQRGVVSSILCPLLEPSLTDFGAYGNLFRIRCCGHARA